MKKNQLPENWCVKYSKEPGFLRVIEYLNNNTTHYWAGTNHDQYYGTRGASLKPWDVLITVQEFLDLSYEPQVGELVFIGDSKEHISQARIFLDFVEGEPGVYAVDGEHNDRYRAGDKYDRIYWRYMKPIIPEDTASATGMQATEVKVDPNQPQTISREGMKELHDAACHGWKKKLAQKANDTLAFKSLVEFTDDELIEIYDASSFEQRDVLNRFFARPVKPEDKSILERSLSATDMEEVSKKLMGDPLTLQILNAGTPSDRPELKLRALYLATGHNVEVGEAQNGGTFIYITKK